MASATITGGNIAAATITGANIWTAAITATQIASLTITATQIANLTITASQIALGTITADRLNATTLVVANITGWSGAQINVGTGLLFHSGNPSVAYTSVNSGSIVTTGSLWVQGGLFVTSGGDAGQTALINYAKPGGGSGYLTYKFGVLTNYT